MLEESDLKYPPLFSRIPKIIGKFYSTLFDRFCGFPAQTITLISDFIDVLGNLCQYPPLFRACFAGFIGF
jgi:hypothetical protein